ncbi:hypothetical protein ACQ4PT_015136 [Festuca glaucescens]
MPSVKIVEVARVAMPATAALPPGESSLLRLSALDAPWLLVPLIQRVLIYDGQLPPFASLVGSLHESLTATLARFPPLAGRIVFLPSTGNAAIDCSGSELDGGVRFLVAEMDEADAEKLAGDADHDVDTFQQLLPELDASALPAEVLAVQVTRLRGGVAIGVALHHAVVDGRALWMFLEAWAAACRGDTAAVEPSFDRAAIALPGGEELTRSTLRKYMPNLPQVAPFPAGPIVPRRTFTVAEERIGRLKQRIAQLIRPAHESSAKAARPPSSFVAVTALAWVSYVRSKHPAAISADQDVCLYFFFDIRGRRGIVPPVSESYFGTCVTGCLVKAKARDLLAEDGIATAAAAVQGEVRRAVEDPLANWDWIALAASALSRDSALVSISGSTRFPAYEVADFGWGPLGRTELVTMNSAGQVVLVAAKGGGGGVQASVCMHPDHMEAFDAHFTNSFD